MLVSLFFVSLCAALASAKSFFAGPKKFFNSTHSTGSIHFFEKEDDRIYGGTYAVLGQFPFMAVVHRLAGNGNYFVCGGTILSRRWVLTAAHCVNDKPQKFLVAFGVVDKSEFGYDRIGREGVAMITNQVIVSPGFIMTPYYTQHDIALLYMPQDIPFGDTIQPIRLAGASHVSTTFQNRLGHIYGWGKDWQGGRAIQRLKYGRVPIIPLNGCGLAWLIDGTHICTDASTKDNVCQGDSGGPLVVMERDDEPLQVGIVSYGDARCPSVKPSVFTRVSAYNAWITSVTGISW